MQQKHENLLPVTCCLIDPHQQHSNQHQQCFLTCDGLSACRASASRLQSVKGSWLVPRLEPHCGVKENKTSPPQIAGSKLSPPPGWWLLTDHPRKFSSSASPSGFSGEIVSTSQFITVTTTTIAITITLIITITIWIFGGEIVSTIQFITLGAEAILTLGLERRGKATFGSICGERKSLKRRGFNKNFSKLPSSHPARGFRTRGLYQHLQCRRM